MPQHGKPDAVAAGQTSQVSRDTEAYWQPFYQPRRLPYQRLDLFAKAYNELAVIHQGIEALVLLCNGELVGDGADSEADKFALDLLRSLNFSDTLDRSFRQYFVFGYDGTETVWSADFRDIIKFAVVDSRTLYVRKTRQGDLDEYLQIPSLSLPGFFTEFAVKIPADRMTFCRRAELGNNIYGISILQPLHQSGLFRTLQKIERSKGEIYERLAANPQHFNFSPRPNDKFNEAVATAVVGNLKKDVGKRKLTDDVFTAGPITNQPLFKFDGMDLSKDQQFVLETIMAGLQLVPELFGWSFGQAQSQTRETIQVMIDRIHRVRRQRAYQINQVIMPQIMTTYNLSSLPQVKFTPARIVDNKAEAERLNIAIVPIMQMLKVGFISGDTAAQMLEIPGVHDSDKLDEWITGASQQEQPQPDADPIGEIIMIIKYPRRRT